jgi:hypothetical protein
MSKAKVVRTQSTPVLIPSKRRVEAVRKTSVGTPTKGILKGVSSSGSSPGSEYSSTPTGSLGSTGRQRKTSQVRFDDSNIESPDFFVYDEKTNRSAVVSSPMIPKRKVSLAEKSPDNKYYSEKCLAGLDNDKANISEEIPDNVNEYSRSSITPPLKLSSSMSNEAKYAILKAYEDELYEKISETFPHLCDRLKSTRSHTPDFRNHTQSELDNVLEDLDEGTSIIDPVIVARRLEKAMDILDSVKKCNGQKTSTGNVNYKTSSNVKSFEKWCQSLRLALVEVESQ